MAKVRLGWSAWFVGLAVLGMSLFPGVAGATLRFGPDFQLSGDLAAQNLVRMRTVGGFNLVQQRNTARIRIDYDLLKDDRIAGKWDAPDFIDTVKLYMLYRGVYDSYFDFAPGGQLYDFTGHAIPSVGAIGQTLPTTQSQVSSSARDAVKWESVLREAYTDIAFKQIPLSLRIGKQQIVWGESDNFRLLDRVNALDLTWHLQQETEIGHSWDQLRIPYWMIKWLYQLDSVGPVNNAYVEGFWNPGDWYPNKRRFLPYSPWSLPVVNPITYAGLSGKVENSTLFYQGDYSRNPADNSQVGMRFGGQAGGVDFTIAYIWARYNQDDGANTAFIQADPDLNHAIAALGNGILPAKYIVPYVQNFGFSANYYDDFTGAVLKTEQIYAIGMPFTDGDKPSPVPGIQNQLFGTTDKNMWQGLIGFDRPTWIRWANPRATWLILGQFFWHYLQNNEHAVGDNVGLVGNLTPTGVSPLVNRTTGEQCIAPTGPPGHLFAGCKALDTVRDWELLATLAATSFYLSGTLVPQLTYAVDPVNSFNMLVAWSADYYLTPDVIVNMAQRYYINTTEKPVFETWGLAGVNRGRSETQLRLTWQF